MGRVLLLKSGFRGGKNGKRGSKSCPEKGKVKPKRTHVRTSRKKSEQEPDGGEKGEKKEGGRGRGVKFEAFVEGGYNLKGGGKERRHSSPPDKFSEVLESIVLKGKGEEGGLTNLLSPKERC